MERVEEADIPRTPIDPRRPSTDPDQMLRVARSDVLDGVSKVTIAQREGLSRWQVVRILDEASRIGLVRISVGDPSDTDRTLSAT